MPVGGELTGHPSSQLPQELANKCLGPVLWVCSLYGDNSSLGAEKLFCYHLDMLNSFSFSFLFLNNMHSFLNFTYFCVYECFGI